MMCGRYGQRLIDKCPTGLVSLVMMVAAFVIAAVISAPTADARTSKECLAHQITPELVFRVHNAKTTLNRSKSSSQITAFAKSIDAFKPTTKGRLLGLAFTQTQSNIGVGGQSVPVTHRKTCMRLVKVSFEFGFQKSEIYVDRKYAPGTCAFKAILAHEREHMQISARLQKIYAKKIKKELLKRAKRIKPYLTSNTDDAINSIKNRLIHEIKPLIDEFNRVKKQENLKIDTARSYRKVRSRCGRW